MNQVKLMWLGLFHLWTTNGFFDQEIEIYDHRGIRTPNLLIRSQTPYPLGYAACWGLSHFCFFLQWVTLVKSKMAHSACYWLSVSIFFFAQNWYLLSSSLVCLVESGQTDVAGSLSFANHDWDLRPRNWNLRPQRDLNRRSSDSEADTFSVGLWGLRFCFVSQWINWSVKWPSMCSVVSLLPSLVLWVMMVSWLQFFRLGARLGSSTSSRQWIQKLRPQRDTNPQSSDSKSDALSVRLCGLFRSFPFLFFCNEWLRWGVKWHTVLAIVSLSIFCLLEIDVLSSSLFCLVKAGQTDVVGSFSFANPDWDLGPRNRFLRPQMNLNPQYSDSKAETLSVGLWALPHFCLVAVNELAEV